MFALCDTHILRRLSLWFFSFFVMFFVCVPCADAAVSSDARDTDVIKVAIPVSSVVEDQDTAEGYINYTMDYLYAITQYTDWVYEVVQVPGTYESGIAKAIEMLKSGEVDIIAPLKYQEKMDADLYFSRGSYATVTTVLQIPNKVFGGVDFGTDIRVAVLAQSNTKLYAEEYFKKNNLNPQYIECQSVEEQIQAVCNGQADVMLNFNMEYIPNMTVVAEFSPQILYFASDDLQLLNELDEALSYVNLTDPLFFSRLYEKHFVDSEQEMTLEEKQFIEQSGTYVVAVLEGQEPYQYQDPDTGEFKGMSVELLRRIGQTTGLKFEFLLVPSWDYVLDLIEEGKVQIIAGISRDYDFALDRNLTITRNFASAPYMLVSRTTFPGVSSEQRLALMEVNSYTEGYYIGDVLRFSTMKACIEAVKAGKADYTYVDFYTAQFFLNSAEYSSLQMTSQAYDPREVCFGLAKPTEHELLNILNKAITQISDSDMQSIISESISQPHTITLADLVLEHPVESVLVVGGFGLVVIGLLLFLCIKKAKLSRILRQKMMEDGLTGLYNSAACRSLVTEKLQALDADGMGAFLLMDMDDFKQVNDRYGHQTGDRILMQFGELLKDTMPENSILARIGGDEFVVYLESVASEDEINTVCAALREDAHSIRMGDEHVTISIGAVAARKEDDYDALYRIADGHMYRAKRNEKDQFSQAKA